MEASMYKLYICSKVPIYKAYLANTFGTKIAKDSTQFLQVWHRHLRHVNHKMVKKMAMGEIVDILVLSNPKEQLVLCPRCAIEKSH